MRDKFLKAAAGNQDLLPFEPELQYVGNFSDTTNATSWTFTSQVTLPVCDGVLILTYAESDDGTTRRTNSVLLSGPATVGFTEVDSSTNANTLSYNYSGPITVAGTYTMAITVNLTCRGVVADVFYENGLDLAGFTDIAVGNPTGPATSFTTLGMDLVDGSWVILMASHSVNGNSITITDMPNCDYVQVSDVGNGLRAATAAGKCTATSTESFTYTTTASSGGPFWLSAVFPADP